MPARFDDTDKDRVRDATDIVDVIGEHLELKPAGNEFKCLCPFHDDRNPSMCVVPRKQMYHCFVCGAGGDAFKFVMHYHGMGFREALEFLAQRAGIELSSAPKRERLAPGEPSKDDMARACAIAHQFFLAIIRHNEHGAKGRACIADRAIAPEMVEAFGIGAAPDRWDGLLQTATKKGITEEAMFRAGLLKQRDSGGHYDVFRDRLIFPIHDQAGRPIAFGGRRLADDDSAKYLNSPESPLFDKSATLYGLAQGGRAIRDSRRVIVTEGYTDVIACHQHGFTNVVATLGTALTEKHARILRRMCDEVILLFDGDQAGQRAADRAFEVFFPEAMDVRVVTLPGGADPDDLLKQEDGGALFREALAHSTDVLEHRVRRLEKQLEADGHARGSAGRGRVVEQTVQRLSELGLAGLPPVRRRAVLDRLASIAGVDARTVAEASNAKTRTTVRRVEPQTVDAPIKPSGPAQHALACLLENGALAHVSLDDTRLVLENCAGDERIEALLHVVTDLVERGDDPDVASVLRETDDERVTGPATALARATSTITQDSLGAYFSDCVGRLRLDRAIRTNQASDDPARALEAALAARRTHQTNATGMTRHASRAHRANSGSTPTPPAPPAPSPDYD
ncbi:MAG: DNA primase, partial [Planctomycetota bacterium]